jgi:cyclase
MRLIPRLDIKNDFVIKGINLEGLRKIGKPLDLLEKYYKEGADEICLIDSVASLYGRNNLFSIIENATIQVWMS